MPRRILWLIVVVVSLTALPSDGQADPVQLRQMLTCQTALPADPSAYFAQPDGLCYNALYQPDTEKFKAISADSDFSRWPVPEVSYFRGAVTIPPVAAPALVLAVPEPAVLILLGTGLVITATRIRRRFRTDVGRQDQDD